jgi:hypothetical protein
MCPASELIVTAGMVSGLYKDPHVPVRVKACIYLVSTGLAPSFVVTNAAGITAADLERGIKRMNLEVREEISAGYEYPKLVRDILNRELHDPQNQCKDAVLLIEKIIHELLPGGKDTINIFARAVPYEICMHIRFCIQTNKYKNHSPMNCGYCRSRIDRLGAGLYSRSSSIFPDERAAGINLASG